MKIRLAILLALTLVSCGAPHTPGTSIVAPAVTPAVQPVAHATVTSFTPLFAAISDTTKSAQAMSDAEPFKIQIITGLTTVKTAASDSQAKAQATETAAAAKDAEAVALRGDLAKANTQIGSIDQQLTDANNKIKEITDSTTRWILDFGILLCVGLAAFGGYLCFKGDLTNGLALAGGGAGGIALCILSLTLQDFFLKYETQIGIGVCIAGAALLVFVAYLAYEKLHGKTLNTVQSVGAAIAAPGVVNMSAAAPILNAVQTPATRKMVKRFQPNVMAPLNGPTNGVGMAA